MTKTEEFIIKARLVHGDKYSYHKVDYVRNDAKVVLVCPSHGDFVKVPYAHLAGQGCPVCSKAFKSNRTAEKFVEASIQKFGSRLDHTKTIYESWDKKVSLFCNTHGYFKVNTYTHLYSKHGCTKCGEYEASELKKSNAGSKFVEKAREVHGDFYIYSEMVYKSCRDKLKIICPIHKDFWQIPSKHLSGAGCPSCAKYGYRQSRPGNFYILSDDSVVKVGITNNDPIHRISKINRSSGKNFKLVCFFNFNDGSMPFNIEKSVLNYLRSNYKPVNETFDGSTECFLDVNLAELINYVTPLAS